MIELFVNYPNSDERIPTIVVPATKEDFNATENWQTNWNSDYAKEMPNKVSLRRKDTNELLGMISYDINHGFMAVEIVYIESGPHSNGNLLHISGTLKKYNGIAKALIAFAIQISKKEGFDGVLVLRAKSDELRNYYENAFKAHRASAFDPYRMIIWEEEAEEILRDYRR